MAEPETSRRDFIKGAALLGAGVAIGGLSTIAIQQATTSRPASALPGGPITLGNGGRAVHVSDLEGDAVSLITGEWASQPATLYKVKRTTLEMAGELRNRDTMAFALLHPSEPEHMIVGYNSKCTHLGCTVGWAADLGASRDVEDYDGDGEPDGRALCPCHQAQFDIHDLGTQLPGTPAPRPLGVLRIEFRGDPDPEIWATQHIPQDVPGAALDLL